jgi:DNA (cytosine-5)-methyltransferase 1
MSRPIAIDLFAGAGGMSLGFEQAGFDVVAAVEVDPIHAAVHKFNFPDCSVIASTVTGLQASEIREKANLIGKEIDVVIGGPPCQGFSLIGQRVLDDPRNALVMEFVRLVKDLDANYFVFENVKGITLGKHRKFLDELIQKFKEVGYDVRLPWKVLNSKNFGVPQDRSRLILFGGKSGLPLPNYPEIQTRAPNEKESGRLITLTPTCADAIGDLPDIDALSELLSSDSATIELPPPSEYAAALRDMNRSATDYSWPRIWDNSLLTSSMRTIHTPISKERFRTTPQGQVEPISRFFKLSSDGIANTLRAGTDGARGAFTSPRPIHYKFDRCISVREMARLHGFPDWFRFHRTKWHGARQIGNAVTPPLAHAIGSELVKAMGVSPSRPTHKIELGEVSLLHLTMEEASRALGATKLQTKRDRKGDPKRKQWQVEAGIRLER